MIAKLLNPGKGVTNIVTCQNEIGTGNFLAAGGKFFQTLEPYPGYHTHIDGGIKKGDPVLDLAENVEAIAINARETSGEVIDANPKIEEILKTCQENGNVPIIHSVYGSKTGICQELQSKFKD